MLGFCTIKICIINDGQLLVLIRLCNTQLSPVSYNWIQIGGTMRLCWHKCVLQIHERNRFDCYRVLIEPQSRIIARLYRHNLINSTKFAYLKRQRAKIVVKACPIRCQWNTIGDKKKNYYQKLQFPIIRVLFENELYYFF